MPFRQLPPQDELQICPHYQPAEVEDDQIKIKLLIGLEKFWKNFDHLILKTVRLLSWRRTDKKLQEG